jgi:hypothetical protein
MIKVILLGAYVTLSVFVYHVIIKTKVILPGSYVTLSVFVYHVIIKTKVILPGAYARENYLSFNNNMIDKH